MYFMDTIGGNKHHSSVVEPFRMVGDIALGGVDKLVAHNMDRK
jgi:hypothetical protein